MYFPIDFLKKKNRPNKYHSDVKYILMYEKKDFFPNSPSRNSTYFKILIFNDNTYNEELEIDKEEFDEFIRHYNQIDDKYKKNKNELTTEHFLRVMIEKYWIDITSFLS